MKNITGKTNVFPLTVAHGYLSADASGNIDFLLRSTPLDSAEFAEYQDIYNRYRVDRVEVQVIATKYDSDGFVVIQNEWSDEAAGTTSSTAKTVAQMLEEQVNSIPLRGSQSWNGTFRHPKSNVWIQSDGTIIDEIFEPGTFQFKLVGDKFASSASNTHYVLVRWWVQFKTG